MLRLFEVASFVVLCLADRGLGFRVWGLSGTPSKTSGFRFQKPVQFTYPVTTRP